MTLQIDTFSENMQPLIDAGWILTEYSRYDPTVIDGLTPTGKAFHLTAVRDGAGALVTLTVAGNTRTLSLPSWDDDFEPGDKSVRQIAACYARLPVAQR